MQSFKNLKVWHQAHVLTLDVYRSRASSLAQGCGVVLKARWRASFKLQWVRVRSFPITSCWSEIWYLFPGCIT